MYGDHKSGLDDPRALDILPTEPWSLLTRRTLGYHDIFGRTTISVAILSATIVALALMAQATQFGPVSLLPAALLMTVNLCVGSWPSHPELEAFFVTKAHRHITSPPSRPPECWFRRARHWRRSYAP